MARALSFLIRYFSNYYTLHRSDLAARAAPLDPRLCLSAKAKVGSSLPGLPLYSTLVLYLTFLLLDKVTIKNLLTPSCKKETLRYS